MKVWIVLCRMLQLTWYARDSYSPSSWKWKFGFWTSLRQCRKEHSTQHKPDLVVKCRVHKSQRLRSKLLREINFSNDMDGAAERRFFLFLSMGIFEPWMRPEYPSSLLLQSESFICVGAVKFVVAVGIYWQKEKGLGLYDFINETSHIWWLHTKRRVDKTWRMRGTIRTASWIHRRLDRSFRAIRFSELSCLITHSSAPNEMKLLVALHELREG